MAWWSFPFFFTTVGLKLKTSRYGLRDRAHNLDTPTQPPPPRPGPLFKMITPPPPPSSPFKKNSPPP